MAIETSGEVGLELAGEYRVLRLSVRTIMELESYLGKGIGELIDLAFGGHMTKAYVLFTAMLEEDFRNTQTVNENAKKMMGLGSNNGLELMANCIRRTFGVKEEADKENSGNTQPQASQNTQA